MKSNSGQIWNHDHTQVHPLIHSFTSAADSRIDHEIFLPYDIKATLAHAEMLLSIGILSEAELTQVQEGLNILLQDFNSNTLKYDLNNEDCHTTIEQYLTNKYGAVGKKIHTARSRNDQALTMIRLYEIESLKMIQLKTNSLIKSFKKWSKKNTKYTMPGYTHQQKAMPIKLSDWQMVYAEALVDILVLTDAALKIMDQNPLGSGAGFGIPISIDRELTTKLLGFSKVQKNPLYCQFSRGIFEDNFTYLISQIGSIVSKWANDLMLFTMSEFEFLYLPSSFCTGSSMMPNKRNYDVLELLRASRSTLKAAHTEIESIHTNLHIGYNRDLQNLKEPLVRCVSTTLQVLEVAQLISQNLEVNPIKIKDSITEDLLSTQKAYQLVSQNVPFREAYQKIKNSLTKGKNE